MLNPDDCEFMQYTGLKDKNGVEICEGDILNIENGTRNPYEVKWSELLLSYTITKDRLESLISLYAGSYEVIGNIHENPELLEKAS